MFSTEKGIMKKGITLPMSDEELMKSIEQKKGMPGNSMNVCLEELRIRFQQKLVKETHSLTIATWALAMFTMLLSVIDFFRK